MTVSFFEPEEEKCDFCLSPNVRWTHFCERFMLPATADLPEYGDDGEWAACEECHQDLLASDITDAKRALADRATAGWLTAAEKMGGPFDFDKAMKWQERILDAFFAHSDGKFIAEP